MYPVAALSVALIDTLAAVFAVDVIGMLRSLWGKMIVNFNTAPRAMRNLMLFP
jgi:hypothetical protein